MAEKPTEAAPPRCVIRATSDLHLTHQSAPWVMAALRELRADAQASALAGERYNVTMILGDVLNQSTTVHMPTYVALRTMFAEWPGALFIIPGNHDQYGASESTRWDNALTPLDGGSCKVITTPTWTRYGRFLPYCKPDQWADELRAIASPPVGDVFLLPMVWCHAGFKGAYRNAMSIDHDGVSCGAIPKGHIVITGHYHMPQNLGRIVYCGSPYETSFAEEGQQKGWLRWSDAVTNPVPERISFANTGAPRHVTIDWDPREGDVTPDLQPNDKPRIVTPLTRREMEAYKKDVTRLGLGGIPIVTRGKTVAASRGVIDERLGPMAAVDQYMTHVCVEDGTKPDPDEMNEYADKEGLWAS